MNHVFWLAVFQVICIDVLLSGDNAVVIAMACRSLPPRQRMVGIIFGVVTALALRLLMAGVVSHLLAVPFLKIAGGIILLYIAVKVIRSDDSDEKSRRASSRLLVAIATIAVADATMSLDNVVAIAAAADGDDLVFAIGLAVSMPLMIVGASLITAIVVRFPIIVWAGGGLLGWIAGGMIISDPYAIDAVRSVLPDAATFAHYGAAIVGTLLVLTTALSLLWLRPISRNVSI